VQDLVQFQPDKFEAWKDGLTLVSRQVEEKFVVNGISVSIVLGYRERRRLRHKRLLE
jgi:hypothetical protein